MAAPPESRSSRRRSRSHIDARAPCCAPGTRTRSFRPLSAALPQTSCARRKAALRSARTCVLDAAACCCSPPTTPKLIATTRVAPPSQSSGRRRHNFQSPTTPKVCAGRSEAREAREARGKAGPSISSASHAARLTRHIRPVAWRRAAKRVVPPVGRAHARHEDLRCGGRVLGSENCSRVPCLVADRPAITTPHQPRGKRPARWSCSTLLPPFVTTTTPELAHHRHHVDV